MSRNGMTLQDTRLRRGLPVTFILAALYALTARPHAAVRHSGAGAVLARIIHRACGIEFRRVLAPII